MGIRKKKNGEGSITLRSDGRYQVSLCGKVTTAKDWKSANAKLKELKVKAESYALRKSGRSARAARQFVDFLHAQQK